MHREIATDQLRHIDTTRRTTWHGSHNAHSRRGRQRGCTDARHIHFASCAAWPNAHIVVRPRESATQRAALGRSARRGPPSAGLDGLANLATADVALFLAIVVVLHALQPELDPAARFVSEYAPGPAGWLMNVAFLALAAALAAFAIVFGRQLLPPLRSRPAGVLFAVASLGIVASAVFNSDLQTDAVATTQGMVHDLAGFVAFLALLPAMVAVGRRMREHRPDLAASRFLTVHD